MNDNQDLNEQKKQRALNARVVRRIVLGIVLVLVLLAIVGLAAGYFYVQAAISPMDESDDSTVEVEIPSGSSMSDIGVVLEDEDLISNSTFFHYYSRLQNASGLQAGVYELDRSMDLDEIIDTMQEGPHRESYAISYMIPEGWWLEDIAATIAEESPHDIDEVMDVLNSEEYAEGLIEEHELLNEEMLDEDIRYPLEGYLFPATYEFLDEDVSVEWMVESMLQQTVDTYEQVESDADVEYDLHEVLTLASIVEREAQTEEDRRLIAGVLFNRLEEEMPLEVDPTVAYAQGEHLYMTSLEDIEIDDAFNTYQYDGLPPGPIASPGEDAIRAVFEPEDTDYLFFYARVNGEVIYSETYEEHNDVHETYRDEWMEAQEEEGSGE
ncbi:endolytic transglycosylase MltG [Salicibibacter cibarius]|uniref:Endolytic murein transglycosylase n=1 Tax=Salicibibacter cibarius TaxID=2743000 RepID=A0A7T6Z2D6_9BACI|nr:endolytic transglycosylase MltG [Salicibibacter cibarius]QQK75691.1 endolytic transglycosylase MltG [Salicibibacter cibarius]